MISDAEPKPVLRQTDHQKTQHHFQYEQFLTRIFSFPAS
jgi:hypothetical protein